MKNNEIVELLKENNRLLNQLIGIQLGLHSTLKVDIKPFIKGSDLLCQISKPQKVGTLKDLKEMIDSRLPSAKA